MILTAAILCALLAVAGWGVVVWMIREKARLQGEQAELRETAARLEEQLRAAAERHTAELAQREGVYQERMAALEQLREEHRRQVAELNEKYQSTFGSLAAEALKSSSTEFLKLAREAFGADRAKAEADLDRRRAAVDELIRPMAETLKRTDEKLAAIEKARTESFAALGEQIRGVQEAGALLRSETGKLVRALREPHVRGRYGEIQLRRVAELAGMVAYCDFTEQSQTVGDDGKALRPDMVVKLPNDRCVVVDAKTNIQAYLEALEAETPDESEACLERFARHVAEQASALAKKKYWAQYDGSPEFVVMFVPGDQFIDAALSRRPDLLDTAAGQGVILASPSTLIGMLRAVAVGWKEDRIAKEAEELRRLGAELHKRAADAMEHVARLGRSLDGAVDCYNRFVGSYQSRLEPTLRRFDAAGAKGAKELPEIETLTVRAREVEGLSPPLLDGAMRP